MDTAISEIAVGFGIKPQRIIKNKYFYIITSGSAEYKLYSTTLTCEEICSLSKVKQCLVKKGIATDTLLNSVENTPYIKYNDNTYIAMRLIKGNCLCLDKHSQVQRAAEAIGLLHKALSEIPPNKTISLPQAYIGDYNTLKRIKTIINRKNKYTLADTLFLRSFGEISEICLKTIATLKSCCIDTKQSYTHGSLKEENIIFGKDVALINWNGLNIDTPLKDLSYFVKRYVKKFALDAYKSNEPYVGFKQMIEAYTKNISLSHNDIMLLKALILYPEKYIRVFDEYYKHPKPFTPVYITNKISECLEIEEFLKEYVKD